MITILKREIIIIMASVANHDNNGDTSGSKNTFVQASDNDTRMNQNTCVNNTHIHISLYICIYTNKCVFMHVYRHIIYNIIKYIYIYDIYIYIYTHRCIHLYCPTAGGPSARMYTNGPKSAGC